LETVDQDEQESAIGEKRFLAERHPTIEDLVEALADKQVVATWLVRFYTAIHELNRRLLRQEAMLRRVSPVRIQEDDLEQLESMIRESRSILQLKDDFDGMGSTHYTEEVWQRAARFVRLQWGEHFRVFGEPMPLPEIEPGPRGSIDIYWETPDFDLLVNIPSDPQKEAEFSGDRNGKRKFDGTLDTSLPNRGLVSWLAR